jgi:hypothetical protein
MYHLLKNEYLAINSIIGFKIKIDPKLDINGN